jgi:hypothetical protein
MRDPRWEQDVKVLSASVEVPDHVVHRAFVDQSVALNLKNSNYYGLNITAARMLEALEGTRVVADAVPVLARELGQPSAVIERSLASLCRDLAERGLIELRDAGDG